MNREATQDGHAPRADGLHIETRLAHAGTPAPVDGRAGPVNVPVVRTSTVRFPNTATHAALSASRAAGAAVATYGRHGLDTHRALEEAVATLEGGYRALLAPSGLSAITLVLLATLAAGDHALVSDSVYSPVRKVDHTLLQRYGVEVEYFSPAHDDIEARIRPNTRLLYLESPSSLLYEVLDLPALAAIARRHGVLVAADNTWSGGLYYRPLALGAHISVQAATKYLGGHSDAMLGVVTVDSPELARRVGAIHDALGLSVSADEAYLVLRGLRTLDVRLARHQANATEVARYLAGHADVARVYYPALPADPGHALWQRDFTGASGLVSFAFRDGAARRGADFIDSLRHFAIGASWGGYESLALEAAPERLSEHSYWNGHGPVVRLHIGLEHPRDLIQDLAQAFEATDLAARRIA
ncbi:cystathionine beta-lyase [Achromobacter aloeverae]|uniref:Cystathionine beta-lyase n=1 Tax=Achromobacter aloeverae TaxID=1750518 RepID=A0A4Q1HRW7_9BURK|nr:cystathionine beta-lyase [Achromobacter aloeverae]RXN92765.1 cystathionine beta-lyase [Achromobacter aloeverae]